MTHQVPRGAHLWRIPWHHQVSSATAEAAVMYYTIEVRIMIDALLKKKKNVYRDQAGGKKRTVGELDGREKKHTNILLL